MTESGQFDMNEIETAWEEEFVSLKTIIRTKFVTYHERIARDIKSTKGT